MSEVESNTTMAFLATNLREANITVARLSVRCQQNAETAQLANKAADSLSKQLTEAKAEVERLKALLPPEPAPAPEGVATPLPELAAAEPAAAPTAEAVPA
jgi:ABC-type transporter Mla subunit MlaD